MKALLTPRIDTIPQQLKERPQWVVWKAVEKKNGKVDKVPYNARTGTLADSTDPATWSTFAEAVEEYQRRPHYYAGVGYVFAADDPFAGVDLDDCIDEHGTIADWAQEVIADLDTYAEVSPSETGIKAIGIGDLPSNASRKPIELYDYARFFTITGHHLPQTPRDIRDAHDSLNALHARIKPAEDEAPPRVTVSLATEKTEHLQRWADRIATYAIRMVSHAQDREKHNTRIKAAKLWAGLIPHNLATADQIKSGLFYAQPPKDHQRKELKAIEDAIAYGIREPLELPPEPAQPFFDDERWACCPEGHGRLTQAKNKNGWLCPKMGFDCFWWKGEGYTPPTVGNSQPDDEDEPPAPGASVYVPPLPASAILPDDLGRDACPWLDKAIQFSRTWSPRSYDDYHEACALWLLSTIAARRVVLHLGRPRYTNLYINLVGRTSLWAKSSAADTFTDMLRTAGLGFLLAPDESTPQALIKNMAGHVPPDFDELPSEKQTRIRQRLAFAAQNGWYYDEFGQKLSAMMREGSAMADFRGLLRRLDDCKESYESITIGRVADELKAPYLALLANMTPPDMAPHARKNSALWGDGFFARMAFVCPPPDAVPPAGRFPTGERTLPPELIKPLQDWHERLGVPQVRMHERTNAKGEGTGVYDAEVEPLPTATVRLGLGVFDAFYRYDEALRELAQSNDNMDLDGNYARLAEKAMRVAMLLASLSNNNVIEMRHWARAQQIAERWRRSLHNLIETVQHDSESSREADLETKVTRAIERLGKATIVDIQRRALKGASTDELERVLSSLERHRVVTSELTRKGTKRYSLVETKSRKVEIVESRKNNILSTIQTDSPPQPPPDDETAKSRNENTNFDGSTFLPFYDSPKHSSNGNGHAHVDESTPPPPPTEPEESAADAARRLAAEGNFIGAKIKAALIRDETVRNALKADIRRKEEAYKAREVSQ